MIFFPLKNHMDIRKSLCILIIMIRVHLYLSKSFKNHLLLLFIYLFILLYNIVLVLPHINMNPPWEWTCSQSRAPLPPPLSHTHTIPPSHPSATAPSILHPALNRDWWFVSYMILYMFQCHSPKLFYPLPLPQSPKNCSIHLCLFCSLAYRVIITIFLNSIYMR